MAYGDIGAVIDALEFDTSSAEDCWGIHVAGDVYAVAYLGATYGLLVSTVTIDAEGNVGAGVIATYTGTAFWGKLPHIIKIADGVFAVATQGAGFHLTVETLAIAADGSTITLIEKLILVAADCRAPKIIPIAGDVYAISYLHTGITTIKVSTFTISAAGDISAIIDTIDLTATGNYYTTILKVAANVFAIQYNDTGSGTVVKTIGISDAGAITDAVIDTQIIDAATTVLAEGMTEALTGVFAIAHVGTDLDGFISTVTIDEDGNISGVVDTIEYLISDATQMQIIHIGSGICAVTYMNSGITDGQTSTVEIDAAGEITDTVIDTLAFEDTLYTDGMLLPISGDTYAAFYAANGPDGYIKTFDISTPPPAPAEIVHHEMLMGVGP